jgi:hypothetical protein
MVLPAAARALKVIVRPEILIRGFLKAFPAVTSFDFRLAFGAFDRPWYAHGIYAAAQLAARLGHRAVTVIEFGVAQGDGLVAMERLATQIQELLSVEIQVFGFDTGEGLPAHEDYRDLPYVWRQGLYRMDVESVRRRLKSAQLILGDVANTVPAFLQSARFPPIGFVSFDLDYYSSTKPALGIFNGPDMQYLPRVLCYFDDIMSGDQQYSCEDVGELLAIREFNAERSRNDRIRPIYGWKRSLLLEPEWADAVWAYHRFDHCRYNDYIGRPHPASSCGGEEAPSF